MAPRQNTFTVIPNAVGLNAINSALPPGAAAKPPMTSKQAKKLYKQANRQPKLSKAEQRRRDLMEQDRIRKEFEEEGRRARARAAREKKKLKEEQQREEKRKRGLPLVEVHPSQDTIARFVRGFTPAKKPEAAAATPRLPSFEETTETLGDGVDRSENGTVPDKAETSDPSETVENDRSGGTEGEAEEPQAKRRRTSQPSSSVEPDTTGLAAKAEKKPTKSSPNASKGKIPEQDSFSIDPAEAEMLARLADVPVQAPSVTKEEPPTPRILPQPSTKAARPPLGEISANAVSKTDAAGQSGSHTLEKPKGRPVPKQATTSRPRLLILDNGQSLARKAHQVTPTRLDQLTRQHPANASARKPSMLHGSATKSSQVSKSGSMGPPPIPPRFKPPTVATAGSSERPKFLPKHPQQSPVSRKAGQELSLVVHSPHQRMRNDQFLPTSTQLFVLNHVDDLFPTPSQEARELSEDVLTPSLPKLPMESSPRSDPPKLKYDLAGVSVVRRDKPPPAKGLRPPPASFFFSSQDFILSSQDIRELEDNISTPTKVRPGGIAASVRVMPTFKKGPVPEIPVPEISQGSRQSPGGFPKVTLPPPVKPPLTNRGFHAIEPRGRTRPSPNGVSGPTSQEGNIITGRHNRGRVPCKVDSPKQACASAPTGPDGIQRGSFRHEPESTDDSQGARRLNSPQSSSGSPNVSMTRQTLSQHRPSPLSIIQQHSSPLMDATRSVNRVPGPCGEEAHSEQHSSPPKKRFFTSSGGGAAMLVAQERSLRTLAEERRRRELQQQEEDRRLRREQDEPEHLAERSSAGAEEEDFLDDDLDDITEEVLMIAVEGRKPPDHTQGANTQRGQLCRSLSGSIARGPRAIQAGEQRALITQSQETDYGDIDFGDGEDLYFLGG